MARTVLVAYVLGGVLAVALPAAAVTSARQEATDAATRAWLVGTTVRCWNSVLGTVRERGVRVAQWAPGTPPGDTPPARVVDLVRDGSTERGLVGTTRAGQRIEYSCRLREDGALAHAANVRVG